MEIAGKNEIQNLKALMDQYANNTMKFSKYVKVLLSELKTIKDWPGIIKWLERLAELLQEYKTPFLADKLLISRGLAQCLNPNLNIGVHKETLHVYKLIFECLRLKGSDWSKDLGMFSFGLFSFCRYCSVKIKPDLINLFHTYFIPLGIQLTPCAPGLLTSIFPIFEENDEKIKNDVFQLIEGIKSAVGKRYFYGSLWMALLRSPESRVSVLKYLFQEAKKSKDKNLLITDEDILSSPKNSSPQKSNHLEEIHEKDEKEEESLFQSYRNSTQKRKDSSNSNHSEKDLQYKSRFQTSTPISVQKHSPVKEESVESEIRINPEENSEEQEEEIQMNETFKLDLEDEGDLVTEPNIHEDQNVDISEPHQEEVQAKSEEPSSDNLEEKVDETPEGTNNLLIPDEQQHQLLDNLEEITNNIESQAVDETITDDEKIEINVSENEETIEMSNQSPIDIQSNHLFEAPETSSLNPADSKPIETTHDHLEEEEASQELQTIGNQETKSNPELNDDPDESSLKVEANEMTGGDIEVESPMKKLEKSPTLNLELDFNPNSGGNSGGATPTKSMTGDSQPVIEPQANPESQIAVDDDEFMFGLGAEKPVIYDKAAYKEIKNSTFLTYYNSVIAEGTSIFNFHPGRLVVSAALECVQDENKIVRRGILDCLLLNFDLKDDKVFTEGEKIKLVHGVFGLLVRREMSTTRRIYTWLFGEPDFDNNYNLNEENKIVLHYIIEAFSLFFEEDNSTEEGILKPIKILQNFYMEHSDLIAKTLSGLSSSFLGYIRRHQDKDESITETININSMRFIASIVSYFHLMIEKVSLSLKSKSPNLKTLYHDLNLLFNLWCEKELISSPNSLEILRLFLLVGLELSLSVSNKDILVQYTNDDLQGIEILENATELCSKIIDKLTFIDAQNRGKSEFDLALEQYEKAEEIEGITPIDLSSLQSIIDRFEEEFSRLSRQFQYIKVEDTFISYLVNETTKEMLDSEMPTSLLGIFTSCVRIVTKLQQIREYSEVDEKTPLKQLPIWLIDLTQCIKSNEPNICNSSIEGLIFVISVSRVHPIYRNLRDALHSQIGYDLIKGSRRQGITEIVIEKLWELLDFHSFHKMAITMLNEMNLFVPAIVSKSITRTLDAHQYEKKEKAFQRFSTFWKLTSEDPTMSEKSYEINRLGLFMMLDFLDDENPLLRHAAKNWLKLSIDYFERILDPILETMIKDIIWYITDSFQYFYADMFDTKTVFSCFKKIKNIMVSIPDLFTTFIMEKQPTESLKKLLPNLQDHIWLNSTEERQSTYFDVVIVICLRYIQGQALESLSSRFVADCQKINSIACEILELFTTRVPEKSVDVASFVYEPLLIIETHALMNKNYVIQVQLLTLLRIILFDKNIFNSSSQKDRMRSILSRPLLITAIVKGLRSPSPYVLTQYVNFLNTSLNTFCEVLEFSDTKTFIEMVVQTYQDLLESYSGQTIAEDEEYRDIVAENINDKKDYERQSTKQGLFATAVGGAKKDSNTKELIVCLLQGLNHIFKFFLDPANAKKYKAETAPQSGILVRYLSLGMLGNTQELQDSNTVGFESIAKLILLNLKRSLKVFADCWTSSPGFTKACFITVYGVAKYDFNAFQKLNKNLNSLLDDGGAGKEIRDEIVQMISPLFIAYREITLDSFVELWNDECKYTNYPPEYRSSNVLRRSIEIMITIGIKVEVLVEYLSKCRRMKKVNEHYEELKKLKKFNVVDQKIAEVEARLLFILYSFTSYSHLDYIEDSEKRRAYLYNLWTTLVTFLRMFKNPQHPNTSCWILEVYNLFSNKYLPQDLMNIRAIRSDLHYHLNGLLVQMSKVISKEFKVLYKEKKEVVAVTILPTPPSIFQTFVGVKEREEQLDDLFDFVQYTEGVLNKRYRLYTLKVLEKICMETFRNCYAVDRAERIASRTKQFMDNLFPLLTIERDDFLMIEYLSSLIYSILDNSSLFLISQFQRMIRENFEKTDFFDCSKQNLIYWGNILDLSIDSTKNDMLTEFLNNISFNSMFASEEQTKKRRLLALTRVCFIIFSKRSESFMTPLRIKAIVETIKEIIRKQSDNIALIYLILFSFRILILRLPFDTLTNLFINVWPFLMTIMIDVFKDSKISYASVNLKLEALKLLELISVCNFEHFYVHQWVFVYDYFGARIRKLPQDHIGSFPFHSSFNFEPSLSNIMPNDQFVGYYDDSTTMETESEDIVEAQIKVRRTNLIISQSRVDSEEQLKQCASLLLEGLIEENQERSKVPMQSVEDLILADFLGIDRAILEFG